MVVFAVFAVFAVAAAVYGWLIMLTVGMAWHEFDILKPIGFWQAVPFGCIAALAGTRRT